LGDDVTISKLLAILVCAAALPAAAQATPAANYTDLWWNPNESGWGITITQHPTNQIWAIWYTYDPRQQDPS
jgi:Spy/CpxP family protein refolding chaperone